MAQITVLLPVLNGMPYLTEALASLESQTCRDFSVMVWDNGSTDGTVEEARRWIPSRLPGRVVTGEPLPLHLCLARMVEEADSPFCARMDADDVSLPHRFEKQMVYLHQHEDISLVGSQIDLIDPEGLLLPQESWAQFPTAHDDLVTALLFTCPFCHPSLLFRREIARTCGNYSTPSPVEDLELYLRWAQSAQMANLDTVQLRYRLHPTSICAVARTENRHAGLAQAVVKQHSRALFGLDAETVAGLRQKSVVPSLLPLLRSALYRAKGNGIRAWRIVSTPVFIETGRCLTARGDAISKLFFRMMEAWVGRGGTDGR